MSNIGLATILARVKNLENGIFPSGVDQSQINGLKDEIENIDDRIDSVNAAIYNIQRLNQTQDLTDADIISAVGSLQSKYGPNGKLMLSSIQDSGTSRGILISDESAVVRWAPFIDWSYISGRPPYYTSSTTNLAIDSDVDMKDYLIYTSALTFPANSLVPRRFVEQAIQNAVITWDSLSGKPIYFNADSANFTVDSNINLSNYAIVTSASSFGNNQLVPKNYVDSQILANKVSSLSWDNITNKPTYFNADSANFTIDSNINLSSYAIVTSSTTFGNNQLVPKNYVDQAISGVSVTWDNLSGKPTYFNSDSANFTVDSNINLGNYAIVTTATTFGNNQLVSRSYVDSFNNSQITDINNLKAKFDSTSGLLLFSILPKGSNYTVLRQDGTGNLAYGSLNSNYFGGRFTFDQLPIPSNPSNSSGMILQHTYTPQTYSSTLSYSYVTNANIQDGTISGTKISTFLSSKIQWDVADTGNVQILSTDPTQSRALATKGYVDRATTNAVLPSLSFTSNAQNDLAFYLAGTVAQGGGGYRISSVADPLYDQDVSNKRFTLAQNTNTLNSAKSYTDTQFTTERNYVNSTVTIPINRIAPTTITDGSQSFVLGNATSKLMARIGATGRGVPGNFMYGDAEIHLLGGIFFANPPTVDHQLSNKWFVDSKLPPGSYVDGSGNLKLGGDDVNNIKKYTIYNVRNPGGSDSDAVNLFWLNRSLQFSMDNNLVCKTSIENPPFARWLAVNLNCAQISNFCTTFFSTPNIRINRWLDTSGRGNHFGTNQTSSTNQPLLLCDTANTINNLRYVSFSKNNPLVCNTLAYLNAGNTLPATRGLYTSTIFIGVVFNDLLAQHTVFASDTGFNNSPLRIDNRTNGTTTTGSTWCLAMFAGNKVMSMYHPLATSTLIQPKLGRLYLFTIQKDSYYSQNTGTWNALVPTDQRGTNVCHYTVYLDKIKIYESTIGEGNSGTRGDMILGGLGDINNTENFSGLINCFLAYERVLDAPERTIMWDMFQAMGYPMSYGGGQFSL